MALHLEKISAELAVNAAPGWQIVPVDCVASTNQWLLENASTREVDRWVCVTERQTAGTGRGGKRWHTTDGSIIFSLGYHFDMALPKLACLSLITAMAVVEALANLGVRHLAIKWPNDVYLGGAKVGGILIQTQKSPGSGHLAIIGIGLNVQLDDEVRAQITQPTAELASQGITIMDREMIIAKTLNQLQLYFQQFKAVGFSSFLKRWQQLDYLNHQPVVLEQPGQNTTGICHGINADGAILIEVPGAEKKAYYYGEISIRRENR